MSPWSMSNCQTYHSYENNQHFAHCEATLGCHSRVHDDVIKWKHFPRYWLFVRGIHRVPVNSPHKGQWRGALMFSLICGRINRWVNNGEAGDLRRYRTHYDVIVMMHIWHEGFATYLWQHLWQQFSRGSSSVAISTFPDQFRRKQNVQNILLYTQSHSTLVSFF